MQEKVFSKSSVLKTIDLCKSTIASEELSINSLLREPQRNTILLTKISYFKLLLQSSNYTTEQKN